MAYPPAPGTYVGEYQDRDQPVGVQCNFPLVDPQALHVGVETFVDAFVEVLVLGRSVVVQRWGSFVLKGVRMWKLEAEPLVVPKMGARMLTAPSLKGVHIL